MVSFFWLTHSSISCNLSACVPKSGSSASEILWSSTASLSNSRCSAPPKRGTLLTKNRSTCRANLNSLQLFWKCRKTRQRTGPDVKITAVDCQAIGLAFGQSTGALTGTADSWYAPRKSRNAMSESCSMRNQTNNLALFHDGVHWRRESILRLSSHWVTLSAFRHTV